MSAAGASLIPILATPFGSAQLPVPESLNAQLARLFEARAVATHRDPRTLPNPLYFRGRDDLLDWPDDPVQRLKAELLAAVAAIVQGANVYTEPQFDDLRLQARGWFSLVRKDGGIPASSYAQTSWCAIYCVAAPEPSATRSDSGVLRLYETRLGSAFLDASNWRLRQPFGFGHHTWRPVAGAMAVFPATIPHEIAPLRSDGVLTLVTLRVRFATSGQESMPPW